MLTFPMTHAPKSIIYCFKTFEDSYAFFFKQNQKFKTLMINYFDYFAEIACRWNMNGWWTSRLRIELG